MNYNFSLLPEVIHTYRICRTKLHFDIQEVFMKNLNIIITAHNEAEYVKLCIQSIRMYADVENLSVILIDNNSSDGLSEWAMEQTDIAYIQNDDDTMPYGKIINQVWNILELQDDFLLLDPHFILTPFCLSRMMQTLYEDEKIAAVGPLYKCAHKNQNYEAVSDFEEAIAWSNQAACHKSKRVMALSHEAILIKADFFTYLKYFEEAICAPDYTIFDYCFRLIENNLILKVCESALLWNSSNTYIVHNYKPDEELLKNKWGMHYFNSAGNDKLVNMIQHSKNDTINVLEIGCDCGATLLEIKNLFPNANIYGSELNPNAARIASHFATVTANNIEDYDLPYPPNMFDYIIFGDVLEHLHDPYKTVEYCRSLLKDNGHIIASIPNLMHYSVMKDLLKGNFTYTETGLLDKTHIHLFSYNEIVRMFETCGYNVINIASFILKGTDRESEFINQLAGIYHIPTFMFEAFQYYVYVGLKQ